MTAEVIVVGAGLAGASVAWHLAPHARVLLLERAPSPGEEASAQNAAMLRTLGEDPHERALALRTARWLEDPGPDFAHASHRTGAILGLAHDPHELSDGVAHLRAAGHRVEALDRPELVAPALRGSPLKRAWYLPDARVGEPDALIRGFLAGARRHGAELRCRVEVTGLEVEGGRLVGVTTRAGAIGADAVVLAAGAWTSELAARVGLDRPLLPVRRTLLTTRPHPLSRPDHPWCWIDDAGVYARPESGGWLVSGCDEAIDPPRGAGSRGPVEAEPRALAAARLAMYFPALGDPELVGGWSGLRTFAPDRRPVLGADPELPGLWWAAGLGGYGVSTCYGVGEAVATWLRGGTLGWLGPRAVSPGRPWPRRFALRPTGDRASTRLMEVSSALRSEAPAPAAGRPGSAPPG